MTNALSFGSISVTPILDSSIHVPGHALYGAAAEHFPVLPQTRGLQADDWEPFPQHLDAGGEFHMHFGGYLVRGLGDRVVLVDLGVGPVSFPPPGIPVPYAGVLLESLRAAGVEPHEVTDVVFTHLHLDHIGWASLDDAPVFVNATYRCAEQDWDALHAANPPTSALLDPIANRLETWTTDTTLIPGLDASLQPGHTPGSSAIIASAAGARAFLVGDIAHCPHELFAPDWAGLGDVDPVQAARVRQDLADEIECTGAWAGSTHFPGLGLGRLVGAHPDRDFVYDVQCLDEH